MLVSDLFDPGELVQGRGMNALLARAVALGFDPVTAVQMVTRNVADYYHLRDLGGIAPGKGGRPGTGGRPARLRLPSGVGGGPSGRGSGAGAADTGTLGLPPPGPPVLRPPPDRSGGLLALPAPQPETTVRVVKVVAPTITRETTARLVSQKGFLESDPQRDVLKTAVWQRLAAGPARPWVLPRESV